MIPKGKAKLEAGYGARPLDVYVIPRRDSRHKNFFMAFNGGLEELVIQNDLSGMEMRLLTLMMTRMDWDNIVQHTQQELADCLGTSPVVVSRAIAKLRSIDVIREAKRIGKVRFYRVSPYLASKSKSGSHQEVMDSWKQQEA